MVTNNNNNEESDELEEFIEPEEEIREERPTLTIDDVFILRDSGFTDREVNEFASAIDSTGKPQPHIELGSPVWQAAIASRREWIEDKTARGWNIDEVENVIDNFYIEDASRSPWDFIKVEYKPPKKADYLTAIRQRAVVVIERGLPDYYTKFYEGEERSEEDLEDFY